MNVLIKSMEGRVGVLSLNRFASFGCGKRGLSTMTNPMRSASQPIKGKHILSTMGFESYYNIRSSIEALIQDMAKREIPTLDYQFLLKYKPTVGVTQFSSNQQYIMNIQYMNMLLAMTCQQLDLIQKVPYMVLLNPKIEMTHSLYLKTLESLLSCNYPYDLYNQEKMSMIMTQFLNDHEDTLMTLSSGLQEVIDNDNINKITNKNTDLNTDSKALITDFLNKHLLIRIKMKLLATHYLKLMEQQQQQQQQQPNATDKNATSHIGILDTNVNLATLIKHNFEFVIDMCHLQYDPSLLPQLRIVEGNDITVSTIPIILEFIMTEILKNSTRATVEQSMKQGHSSSGIIDVSIFQQKENLDEVSIKISDRGGGIPLSIEPHIYEYSYTTLHNKHEQVQHSTKVGTMMDDAGVNGDVQPINNTIAGMGFGLPLCKLYLELFQGKMEIQNLYCYGTDIYLTLQLPTWPKQN